MTTTTIDISEMSENEIRNAVTEMQPVIRTGDDYVEWAIAHVRKFYPSCVKVLFDNMGRWRYMDADNNAFDFTGKDIDVDLLETASDTVDELPILFQVNV